MDKMYTRPEAAEYLTSKGFKIAAQTLSKHAWSGQGPVFTKFGRHPLYTKQALDEWAQSRLGRTVRSTSELSGGAV